MRYFRFDAERGDVIAVTMPAAGRIVDPFVRVLDASLPRSPKTITAGMSGRAHCALGPAQRRTY